MPVSSPPFPYWSANPQGVYVYSDGKKNAPGRGRNLTLYAANGGSDPLVESYGGDLNLTAGYAYSTTVNYANSYGGRVRILAPDGGDVAGDSTTSQGGYVSIYSGNGGSSAGASSNSYGGHIYFYSGDGGHAYGAGSGSYGGDVALKSGDANSDAYLSTAGEITLRSGVASGSYGNQGGRIRITAGGVTNAGTYYNQGGDINLIAGDITGSLATDFGGSIGIQPGRANTQGRAGSFIIALQPGVARNGQIIIQNIPTAAPAVSGAVWSNLGVLTIVP